MRMTFINTVLCLFIVFIGIALSSSSSVDTDDYAAALTDWSDFDSYYSPHLSARAAKSRFWKRAPPRRFWKRSVLEPAMNNNDMGDFANNQRQEQH
jgi:hypothetical protein